MKNPQHRDAASNIETPQGQKFYLQYQQNSSANCSFLFGM